VSARRARLFVALDLPADIRDELAAWTAAAVRGRNGLRPVAAEALHVTLCFIGSCPESEVEAVWELVAPRARAVAGVLRVSLGGAVWLPARRPRVLAVDLGDPTGALGDLQGEIASALVAGADLEPEGRPFRPHVTVARVRSGAGVPERDLDAPPPRGSVAGAAVTLYRSRLERGGARYEAVGRVGLRRPSLR
jgi:RNA 2',3'-cyclic 3'-phosphodiesterase